MAAAALLTVRYGVNVWLIAVSCLGDEAGYGATRVADNARQSRPGLKFSAFVCCFLFVVYPDV
jgi:hypothetical protein